MWHRAKDVRWLLFGLPALALFGVVLTWGGLLLTRSRPPTRVVMESTRIEVLSATGHDLEVRPVLKGSPGPLLMGICRLSGDSLLFEPALPLVPGQVYQVQWRDAASPVYTWTSRYEAGPSLQPGVSLQPADVTLPANALKLYLHFSQPMEQGVFLQKLRLKDAQGKEIIGPFRETELWSPDGKRLTVWLHPGRQKTGVGLNTDEGPIFFSKKKYTLNVSGSWRSESGKPVQTERVFQLTVGDADHECPQISRWRLEQPTTGTRGPLKVFFDEPLDTAMLPHALQVFLGESPTALPLNVTVNEAGNVWLGSPSTPWQAGIYRLVASPLLEDLAGNSLTRPFERDVTDAPPFGIPSALTRTFQVE